MGRWFLAGCGALIAIPQLPGKVGASALLGLDLGYPLFVLAEAIRW